MAEKRLGKFPWTFLRPLFIGLSMILFLVSLHSLIYVSYVTTKTPDCFECDPQKEDKECNKYCDIIIDDIFYANDPKDRNDIFVYNAVTLLLRCLAFLSGFIGVSTFLLYGLYFYLMTHFSVILSLIGTVIYYAVKGDPVYECVFGRTTTSLVVLSIAYTLELILFTTGVSLTIRMFSKEKSFEKQKKQKSDNR